LFEATTAVRDIAAERAFYTSKLAFKEVSSGGSGGNELSIAGNSGDRVALQAETATTKPRVVFVVANIRQVANDLRSRGLKAQKDHHAISVSDPDGAVIVFVLRRAT
jgi:catechol 2,3-dioxygenase-like lactoylglutathione lyase family enzyme